MQKNAGFTLIEVLIALMIIAIGITAKRFKEHKVLI